MRQANLNTTKDNSHSGHHPRVPRLHIPIIRSSSKIWQRLFAAMLIMSMLLLGPLGPVPVSAALGTPLLLSPANNAIITGGDYPPVGMPEFRWTEVSGTAKYRIQVSSCPTCFDTSAQTPVNVLTSNITYTPIIGANLADGIWYWRVRADSPSPPGNYSDIRWFEKRWATTTNNPTLLSPLNAATFAFFDSPTFSWTPVTGAAEYLLQIYSTPGGWATPVKSEFTLATTVQPLLKLANGLYYWRVVPLDAGTTYHMGTPSVERTFTINYNPTITLLEPANGATPTFTPTFRWTAVRGAQKYRLQYSTNSAFPDDINFTTTINTFNTTYTPIITLDNDVNYYWRVKAISGLSETNYTPYYSFEKHWYIQPTLLTPTNNYQNVRFPIYSWTPVAGAAYYKIEIDFDSNFSEPPAIYDFAFTANTFYSPKKYLGANLTYYWRVIPYDGSGNPGKPSNSFSFQSIYSSVAPHLAYPLYYYTPDAAGIATNPHEDRTVQYPIFMWHRPLLPDGAADAGNIYSNSYLLQVSDDATFDSVDWDLVTQNNIATPYVGDDFNPDPDLDYFWRVCPLIEACDEYSNWSQVWRTRINPSSGLPPTGGASPALIRPTNGFEFAEASPLLEWFPFEGATAYDVEISLDESFSSTVDTAQVSYPAYAPSNSLAQRSLGAVDFGVYYWHVKSSSSATWSETRRFQISASSQWMDARTPGDTLNRLQIGSDPAGELDPANAAYDLTSLQAAQAKNGWFFGFHVPTTPDINVTYALYLDLDHALNSGATMDAMGYTVTTLPAYRPEYAIYIFQEAGAFSATRTRLYQWQGSSWGSPQSLYNIGGLLSFSGDYVEIKVLNTAINYGENTGSYTLSLLSLPYGVSGTPPQDSVPSVVNIPGGGQVNRFSNVTERLNLLTPPNDAGVDPSVYPSVLPFFWDYSLLAPDAGGRAKVWLDEQYTSEVTLNLFQTDTRHWSQTSRAWETDFNGDNTYYWRVQPDYNESLTTSEFGVWSQGYRFERKGFIPQNLQTSVDFATPTFSWDLVEGTQYYDLQVSTDSNFGGTPDINISTRLNSYTHNVHTLAEATYYWRVRVHRYAPSGSGVDNAWTTPTVPCPADPAVDDGCFTLTLPAPTDLTPATEDPAVVVWQAPTLCWTPLIINSPLGDPVLAAWKYNVQYSRNPSFSSPVDVDTEQSCWTPQIGLADGAIYWHVAMIDGEGKMGSYSPDESLIKQYPITTLLSPIGGEPLTTTPTFIWTPVDGAAKYELQTSEYENFGTLKETIITHNTRYTPIIAYDVRKTYYWRVRIIDDDNFPGPFTDATLIIDPYAYAFYLPLIRRP